MTPIEGPLSRIPDGVRVAIRLMPRGHANRLQGVAGTAEGGHVLKISVTAPPVEGRANEALLELLSKAWDLPRRDLAIVAGATGRNKLVQATGDPAALTARLGALIAALPAV